MGFENYLFHDFGSWVIRLIDSVTETEEKSLFCLHIFDEFGNVFLFLDEFEHS